MITMVAMKMTAMKRFGHVTSITAFMALIAIVFLAVSVAETKNVSALATSVNSWILSGQTITVGDQSLTIYLGSGNKEVLADYGAGSLFVKNNSCEQTAIARICLDDLQYDVTDRIYRLKVRGISLAPSISIVTREVDKKELYAGEATKFTVTLKNTGGFARNITYEEKFPTEFEVMSAEGATFLPDRAVWKGTLDEGESASFSYVAKSKEAFDGSLVASLTYFDGLRLKMLYSSKISLKTIPALVLVTSIGKSEALLGEKNNVTVNVTSRLPESADVKVMVEFDPGLKVTSRPYGINTLLPTSYEWSGEILKSSNISVNLTKAWFFEFKGTRLGNSNINIKVSYKPKSEKTAKVLPEAKQSVVVSERGVIVRTSLKDATLEAGQYKVLRMWVQNLNQYVALKDVLVNISTDLTYVPDAFLERMEPQEQALVVDKKFYAPAVEKSAGYVLSAGVSYFTEFGENGTAKFKDTVTVMSMQEASLTAVASPTTVKANEDVEFSVSVRNPRLANLKNVNVADNVSDQFTVLGKDYATVEVKSKETITVYRYKLKAPNVDKEIVLHVNTTMMYSDTYASFRYESPQAYVTTKVTEIKVEPETLPLSVARTFDDSSIYVGEMFHATYKITNEAKDKVARNIVLKIPLDYSLDSIGGGDSVTVPQLGPGETIAVANLDKRRAKLSGTAELSEPSLEYENIYGNRYFVNGTATSLPVKESYLHGPLVLVERVVPQKTNNTDSFSTQLKVRNVGTETANVTVEDEGKLFVIIVQNGTDYLLNSTKRYSAPGKVNLPQAKAAYSYNGVVYRTASKASQVEIVDNPVLKIEKIVPSQVSSVLPYTVMLRLENRAQKSVGNISLSDNDQEWRIVAIPGEGHANVTYQELTREAGQHSMKAATATYVYEGAAYTAQSNSPVLEVEEKKLVSLVKEVRPKNATKDQKVKITLMIKNQHTDELEAIAIDGKKSFTAKLMPGEEKNFSYEAVAGETTGEAASATYTLEGQQLTTVSKGPAFELLGAETLAGAEAQQKTQQKKEKAEEKKGVFGKLADALLSILSWRRGG